MWRSGGGRELRKREYLLIKDNIPRDVKTICRNVETLISFME
jgi:hypothetical protein